MAYYLALVLATMDPYPHLPPLAVCERREHKVADIAQEWSAVVFRLEEERRQWYGLGGTARDNWDARGYPRLAEARWWYNSAKYHELCYWYATRTRLGDPYGQHARALRDALGDELYFSGRWWHD